MDEPILKTTDEVEDAIASGGPIVALESTLLAHGLPAPVRGTVARRLEEIAREEGATPATIAILDGTFRVGLDAADLDRLVSGGVLKASLRDLAFALATGKPHATTVAATMAIAAQAGIRVFATGGIGGVHRDVVESYDESADLAALARFPLAVVCAGAKSVLDLPRTLERLETLGVPVVGFGCSELPAFYHGRSGLPLEARADSIDELAAVADFQLRRLGLGGLLVVQPPPASVAQDPKLIEALIAGALDLARQRGVKGRAVTPFLLEALDARSSGAVVETNVALVEANVRLGARLAVALRRRAG